MMTLLEAMDELIEDIKSDFLKFKNSLSRERFVVGTIFFTAFALLIISVCKLGLEGNIFWGFVALVCAITVAIIGFATGIF